MYERRNGNSHATVQRQGNHQLPSWLQVIFTVMLLAASFAVGWHLGEYQGRQRAVNEIGKRAKEMFDRTGSEINKPQHFKRVD